MRRQKTMFLCEKGWREGTEGGQTWYKSDALPRAWRCIIEQRVGVRPRQSITERPGKEMKGDEMGSYGVREGENCEISCIKLQVRK